VDHIVDRIVSLNGLLVPIAGIVVGGVIAIVAMVHKHQERLAKIERGINPDGPWPQR
jgi:ABC-type enterochelin transport system permease subunit